MLHWWWWSWAFVWGWLGFQVLRFFSAFSQMVFRATFPRAKPDSIQCYSQLKMINALQNFSRMQTKAIESYASSAATTSASCFQLCPRVYMRKFHSERTVRGIIFFVTVDAPEGRRPLQRCLSVLALASLCDVAEHRLVAVQRPGPIERCYESLEEALHVVQTSGNGLPIVLAAADLCASVVLRWLEDRPEYAARFASLLLFDPIVMVPPPLSATSESPSCEPSANSTLEDLEMRSDGETEGPTPEHRNVFQVLTALKGKHGFATVAQAYLLAQDLMFDFFADSYGVLQRRVTNQLDKMTRNWLPGASSKVPNGLYTCFIVDEAAGFAVDLKRFISRQESPDADLEAYLWNSRAVSTDGFASSCCASHYFAMQSIEHRMKQVLDPDVGLAQFEVTDDASLNSAAPTRIAACRGFQSLALLEHEANLFGGTPSRRGKTPSNNGWYHHRRSESALTSISDEKLDEISMGPKCKRLTLANVQSTHSLDQIQ